MLESPRVFVGVDWGSTRHYVCLLSLDDLVPQQRTFENTADGLAAMVEWIAIEAGVTLDSIAVAIERPNGPVVETILSHGLSVFSVNPKQLDRFRDRHCVAGSKDDRRDAFVLADSLRTDRALFSPVTVEDPLEVQLRECLRLDRQLRDEQHRLFNQLHDCLTRYYPAILELADVGEDPFLWDLLETAPTPAKGQKLVAQRIESLLRKNRIRRFDVQHVVSVLRAPTLPLQSATIVSMSFAVATIIPKLRLLRKQRKECATRISSLLESMKQPVPTDDATAPVIRDATLLGSLPGVGPMIVATLLTEASQAIRERNRQALRTFAGLAPVTKRSGKTVLTSMRRACNSQLREAVYHWGRNAMRLDPASHQHYVQLRRKGHSHGRALRGLVDRLLDVAMAMLRSGKEYDPVLRERALARFS